MTPEQILGLALALVVMIAGLIGSVIPGIPGSPLIVAAAVFHKICFANHSASWLVLVLLCLLMVLALLLDFIASTLGAKKFGATWKGILGAILGATVGLFFGFVGIFIGPFIGALAGEMMGGRGFEESTKAGAGALVGLLLGIVGKIACCVAMIGLFVFSAVAHGG
jgi:uncharacterized protein YqgC (DUF456 family)